ncbi:MAG: FecCD family ABC transporter permease [bacterium]
MAAGWAWLAGSAVCALALGSVPLQLSEVWAALWRALGTAPGGGPVYAIVVELRLPRVVLAGLVGAALATSGAVYQTLFRNPLADPYVVGVAPGAALGAVAAIAAGLGGLAVSAAAFASAAAAVFLVYRLAAARGRGPEDLLLAGLAAGTFFAAVLSVVLVLSHGSLQQALAWLLGSLGGRGWDHVRLAAPAVLAGYGLARSHARELDVLLLGEEEASSVGVPVPRVRAALVGAATLMTAAAVASAGLVGFVGLVVPHALRRLGGSAHAVLLPGSALWGAALLVWADLLARTATAPLEIPVGAVTALVGVPFFLWVLWRGAA